VRDQVGAEFAAARNDADHTSRDPGGGDSLGEQESVEHSFRRRLHHHGAPGGQRRPVLEGGQRLRIVPRHDGPDHADRLAAHDVGAAKKARPFLQPAGSSNARRAAATAASTSASAASGTEPMFSSVVAEVTSIRAGLPGRTHSPPMVGYVPLPEAAVASGVFVLALRRGAFVGLVGEPDLD
jgi:hypothetical protein